MIALPDATIAAKFVIKTHYLMRVVEFHPDTQTVDLIQDVYEFTNAPYGTVSIENDFGCYVNVLLKQPDALYNIPVKQLRWGQFEIQCCPKPGDTGYIEVFTNDTRDWMINGSNSVPWSDAHFLKECCVFVPFVPNLKNAATQYPADNSQLVIKSANASIVITDKQAEEGSGEDPVIDITTTAQTLNINAEKGITVTGDINITGNITVTGDIETTGDVTVDGNITATGDITSDKTVTGKEDVIGGGISLKNHTHPFTYSAGPTAGAAGTTNPPA